MGFRQIKENEAKQEMKQNYIQQLKMEKLNAASQQLSQFKNILQEFAEKYKREIREDPDFRAQFNNMCLGLGVDPLQSQKGFWSDLLKIGDFYFELSVKVIDACIRLGRGTRGMVPVNELIRNVKLTYKKPPAISKDDIVTALSKVKVLGAGYSVTHIGSKDYVLTNSFDVDSDMTFLLAQAESKGYFEKPDDMKTKVFNKAKAELLRQELVWVDEQAEEGGVKKPRYYVLALFDGFS